MEKNSSQYSNVKVPQSKVGKITVWGMCGVKSVWTGGKTLVVGGLRTAQRCLELQYLRYQERESCSFLHQFLLPARLGFCLLTCFSFTFCLCLLQTPVSETGQQKGWRRMCVQRQMPFPHSRFSISRAGHGRLGLVTPLPKGLGVRQECSLLSNGMGPHLS